MAIKTFADAIEAAEKVSTHAEKHKALSGIHPHHQRLIHEALNKYRRFHVKKWDSPDKYAKIDYPTLIPFYSVLDRLAAQEVTGDKARELVTKTMAMYTKRTAKYLGRVLKKDLDCGAEAKTFRKIYPEIEIPSFKVMLAKKMESDYVWKFPLIAEEKYDGERILAVVDPVGSVVKYYSRSGLSKDYYCGGLFDKELLEFAIEFEAPLVIDGEVLSDNFQDTLKAKGSKNGNERSKLVFYAFDFMTAYEWSVHNCTMTQAERSAELRNTLLSIGARKVVASGCEIVNSKKEAEKFYDSMFEKNGELKKGRDGVILKDPLGHYEWDRSRFWTKWKPTYNVDLMVVKVHYGKGKYSNTMGTIDCEGFDESGRHIVVNVGGGFKDKDRDFFMKNARKLEGKTVIEVEHYGITQAHKSDTYSLRHPQYLKLREDK